MGGVGMFPGPGYTMYRVQQNQARGAAPPPPPPAPPPPPHESELVAGLRQLAALRDKGIISQQQFEAGKQALLDEEPS